MPYVFVNFILIPVLWLVWLVYWVIAAFGSKAAIRRDPIGARLLYTVPLFFAAVLLWGRGRGLPSGFLFDRFVPLGPVPLVAGAALVIAGLGFAVWARVHLGGNWSGRVSVKQDHELVQTGPYAVVRHPIYTGLLLALLGTAVAKGQVRGLIAFLLALAALVYKLRREEALMAETFGDLYRAYSTQVAALIPYVF